MDYKNTVTAKTTETAASTKADVKPSLKMVTYDPDDYMNEYYLIEKNFYINENCFCCKHWYGYECGLISGECRYTPF